MGEHIYVLDLTKGE